MTNTPSLHLVLLHDSLGSSGNGLDYGRFRQEVRKYKPHGDISESSWYIVSADDDIAIKGNLSRFLPDRPREKQISSKSPGGDDSDPRLDRLFVVRVYQPGVRDLANPDMKALYEKLTQPLALLADALAAAE